MSNKVNETCREHSGRLISWNLAFDGPTFETLTECGIDVEGLPDNNPQAMESLKEAKRTGSSAILSNEDALVWAIVQDTVEECIDSKKDDWDVRMLKCSPDGRRQQMKIKLSLEGVASVLESLPEEKRTAIAKRAERFLENARMLVEKLIRRVHRNP